MPVNVISAADLLRDLVQQALGEDRKAADHIPTSLALRWLSDSYREIVRRVQFLQGLFIADLTAGALSQPGPTDILDRLTIGEGALRVKDAQGIWRPLNLRDWKFSRDHYLNLGSPLTGEPIDWTFDEVNPGNISVMPPAPVTIASGLILDYVKDPGPLSRIYDDPLATCSVVNGSDIVTFGVSVTGRVLEGDVFGVKTDLDALPDIWYRVASVAADGLTITLSDVWADITQPAALFTLSQVSPCEWTRPGLCLYAPVQYALWKYWTREDQARAMNYQIAFWGGSVPQKKGPAMAVDGELQRIAKACGDRPGLDMLGKNITTAYAGNRARMSCFGGNRSPYRAR